MRIIIRNSTTIQHENTQKLSTTQSKHFSDNNSTEKCLRQFKSNKS